MKRTKNSSECGSQAVLPAHCDHVPGDLHLKAGQLHKTSATVLTSAQKKTHNREKAGLGSTTDSSNCQGLREEERKPLSKTYLCGRSPVCSLLCLVSAEPSQKRLLHTSH